MLRQLSLALTAALLFVLASDAQAGRRGYRYQAIPQPTYQPVNQPANFVAAQAPVTTTSYHQPSAKSTGDDALAEVNAQRASRGLRPFVRDEGLTQAARACAAYRAQHRMEGHTANDFAFVPAGSIATSAGCACWPPAMGWGSCCTYDGYTYAGAAWSMGADGQRYMSLFVR